MKLSLRISVLLAVLFAWALPAYASEAPGPSLVFEPFSGEVISQYRAGEPWYPASLTKLMTSYVIFKKLRAGTMSLGQQLPISPLAHAQPASHTGLPAGKTISLDLALQALLVYSANDMAYVLAEAADGSSDAFAQEMNFEAQSMGLTSTHFVNPNGLYDPRHISSARDIGVIAAAIINQFPEYLHYFSQADVAVGKRRLRNHNSLIRVMPEAVGMKTGFICNSGYSLVGSAIQNGKQLVSVVLGAHSSNARTVLSKTILENGFAELGKPGHTTIKSVPDQAYGSIVPADMTTTVCKQKQPVTPVNPRSTSGWAVSFGAFDTAMKADMALRGHLINPIGIDAGGVAGVVKMMNDSGYAPMIWNLDQAKSTALCGRYKAQNSACDVIPDTLLLEMAAAAPPENTINQTTEEGDTNVRPPPKSVKKHRHSHKKKR